jgi:hypothetical protein
METQRALRQSERTNEKILPDKATVSTRAYDWYRDR